MEKYRILPTDAFTRCRYSADGKHIILIFLCLVLSHLANKHSSCLVTLEFQVNSDSKYIPCNIKIQVHRGMLYFIWQFYSGLVSRPPMHGAAVE